MTVFANGLEVACVKQSNRILAAFPDVCFTPPENPATPPGTPVPYPSFSFDSDTEKGTGSVKIDGETVTQKNLSRYKKSSGTEAGRAAKKGLVSSNNTGREEAHAWSTNVKMDGEPVSRFGDIGTNNHSSPNGNSPPMTRIGKLGFGGPGIPFCPPGSHDEMILHAAVDDDEIDTSARIRHKRQFRDTGGERFESLAVDHNRSGLGDRSGCNISRPNYDDEGGDHTKNRVWMICRYCGQAREVDHVLDDGTVVEAKSGGIETDQLANNATLVANGTPVAYKVPGGGAGDALSQREQLIAQAGCQVVRVAGWGR